VGQPLSKQLYTASHDEEINSWVSFSFPYEYGAPLGGPPAIIYKALGSKFQRKGKGGQLKQKKTINVFEMGDHLGGAK